MATINDDYDFPPPSSNQKNQPNKNTMDTNLNNNSNSTNHHHITQYNYQTDMLDPFFMHPSHNPSQVIFIPSLNNNNYHSWSRSIKVALQSNNKLGFIDGTPIRPITSYSIVIAWDRCNTMVMSWITNFIDRDIVKSVIWINLLMKFGKTSMIGLIKVTSFVYMIYKKIFILWSNVIFPSHKNSQLLRNYGETWTTFALFLHVAAILNVLTPYFLK